MKLHMKKKLFSLFLAMAMALSLAAPASAALSPLRRHTLLEHLPTTVQRPVPYTLELLEKVYESSRWPYTESKESVFAEFTALIDSLTAGKANDTEKMKAIFEWVSQNFTYETEGDSLELGSHPLDLYLERSTNCAGYAHMCEIMGVIAGLRVGRIHGISNEANAGSHSWNAALLDGKWVFFDATWHLWDIAPDYHITSSRFDYNDGIYRVSILDKGTEDGSVEMTFGIRWGLESQCPANLTIPAGVTEVNSFYQCTNLERATLPDSVTSLGGGAFNGCTNLKSVNIPNSVTTIGNSAFMGCTSLKSIAIPDSVTTLENLAFAQSGLTSVTVPGSVTRMEAAFYECADLESVTLSRGITSIQDSMFMGCTSLKDVIIPDTVKTIEDQAFWNCTGLERVTIPDGVTSIGKLAFADCKSLKQADLPDSVTSIDGSAFTGCTSLKQSAAIPGGMTTIADGTFQDRTDLTSFVIPDHITEIGNWAFRNCTNLQSVTIPSSVTTIGNYAFGGCTGMTSMTIPEGVVSIGHYATSYTLTNITIPTSVTSIGGAIFGGSMTDVYYAGTEAQWKAIAIEEPNYLDRVTVHYNSTGPDAPSPAPDDIPSDWARAQVDAAIQAALVPGDLQGAYRSNITREEFCRLMVVLVEKKTGTTASAYAQSRGKSITDPFTDTDSAAVLAAYALGIVNGTSATTFNPVGSITRQEAASMLARTAGVLDISTGTGQSFRDESDIASWAKEGVGFVSGLTDPVTGNAVMGGTGDGRFSPLAPYTREQACLTALRLSRCGE